MSISATSAHDVSCQLQLRRTQCLVLASITLGRTSRVSHLLPGRTMSRVSLSYFGARRLVSCQLQLSRRTMSRVGLGYLPAQVRQHTPTLSTFPSFRKLDNTPPSSALPDLPKLDNMLPCLLSL